MLTAIFTWVTPPGETAHYVRTKLKGKTADSWDEALFVVEIQIFRSTQFWSHSEKSSESIKLALQEEEEPIISKLFPVSFHDILARRGVFRKCNFMPVLSCIYDYVGDMFPSNFTPESFIDNLEDELLNKIYNDVLPGLVDPAKRHYFVAVPIKVVRIVEELYEEGEECFVQNIEFVQKMIESRSPTSNSSLFDAVDMKIFCWGDGEEHCSICLKEFENGTSVGELACFHVFHMRCIVNWFERGTNCPLCRSREGLSENNS